MAVLEKMRVKMGAFVTIVIALALLAFIINPEDLRSAMSMFSSKYDVGEINGKGISSQEFQKKVDYYTHIYQITSGTTATNEQTQEMLNNSAWESEITDLVLVPACKKAGLAVGSSELVDMSSGTDISPVIANEAIFQGENGFDSNKLLDFVQQIPMDKSGNLQMYWDFVQQNMSNDRLFTKYASLLAKSNVVNNLQLRREVANNNTAYNVEFVVKPTLFVTDSTIKVSNEEVKKYYNTVKNSLLQPENRDAEFVVFEVLPSDKDKAEAKAMVDKAYEEFLTTSDKDMKSFLAKNSDSQLAGLYVKSGDLAGFSATLDNFVSNSPAGSFLEPQVKDNIYYAAKVLDVASRPDSVFVKYIPAMRESLADSLLAQLAGGADFAMLASQYIPQQQNVVPGDLGWITESVIGQQLPLEFGKVFSAKAGETFKVESNGGWFVVRASQITKPVRKARVALLSREAAASNETNSEYYSKASEVVNHAEGDIKKFEAYAHENNLTLYPVEKLLGGAKNIVGFNNVKEVSRWIFENKEGSVSPIISVNNQYFFVAAVKQINEAGTASLKSVYSQIESYLTQKKKVHKLAEESRKLVGENPASIEEVATKLGSTVNTRNDITFSTLTGGQQLDLDFIGAVAKAGDKGMMNKILGPVEGQIGVYYFNVLGKETGAYFTESDARAKSNQTMYQILGVLPQIMQQDANVVDMRYKFY